MELKFFNMMLKQWSFTLTIPTYWPPQATVHVTLLLMLSILTNLEFKVISWWLISLLRNSTWLFVL